MAAAARNHEYNEESEQLHASPPSAPDEQASACDSQPAQTFEVMQRLSISASEVWLYYLSMGGVLDELEITAYLHGLLEVDTLERDMISQAVNELYDDIRRSPRAPYSWQCAGTDTNAEPEREA